MQTIEIGCEVRTGVGKGPARQLRMRGRIPAVMYGAGGSTPLSLDTKEVGKMLRSTSGENVFISLRLADGNKVVILRDSQRDPITSSLLHADLFEVSLDKPIDLRVPLEVVGTSSAGKEGQLQVSLRQIHIRCLPALIPDRIRVDITPLKMNQSIHIKDLQLAEGIKVLDDLGQPVVSITAGISEAKLAEMLAGAPKDEAATPEVIGEKKEETAEAPKKAETPKK
jgi:large subunit ribosomal protein L25